MRLFTRLLALLCMAALSMAAQQPRVQPGQPRREAPPPVQQPPAPQPQPPAIPDEQLPRFIVPVTRVLAPVTVTDDKGEYVMDLKPEDFHLMDDGVPQKIAVDFAEMPLSLVILMSTSAKLEPLVPQIRKLGNLFTDLVVGQTGEAAVVAFDHRVEVALPFTTDPERLQKVFKDLKVGSEQARLTDAVARGLTMLGSRPPERRKVILIVAEGRDMGSETDLGFALSEAQRASVSIYSVGLSGVRANLTRQPPNPGPGPFPPAAGTHRPGIVIGSTSPTQGGDLMTVLSMAVRGVKGIFFDNPLEAYAEGTGARHVGGFSESAVQDAVSRIGREIRSQYLLSYRPNNLKEPKFHEIRVTVDRRGVNVRTRPGYYYPGGGAVETAPAPPTNAQ